MEPLDIITACSAVFSIIMALFGIGRAKRSADVAVAVDRTTQDLKTAALERRVEGLQSVLNGVKSGLEIGMGRLQESFTEVNRR